MLALVLQLLTQADVSCKLCMVLSELVFCEVNNLHLPHNKKGFRRNCTQFKLQLASAKIRS